MIPFESERRESPLTQQEQLELVTDTILAAVDLAGKLPIQRAADQTIRELYVGDHLPTDLQLPRCWANIYEPLTELRLRYTRNNGDDHVEMVLLATFGDDAWQSIIRRPAHAQNGDPFTGETIQTVSPMGPVQRETGSSYPAEASLEEVSAFITSLIHAHSFQTDAQPIFNPTEQSQAVAIADTLEYALSSPSISTSRYDFFVGDEHFDVVTETEQSKITSIQIGQILRDDIIFEDGAPKNKLDKLVANIELEDFQHAVTFYSEMEDAVVEEKSIDPDMIREILRIISVIEKDFKDTEQLPFEVDDDAATHEKLHWRYGEASPDIDHDAGMYTDDDQPPTL